MIDGCISIPNGIVAVNHTAVIQWAHDLDGLKSIQESLPRRKTRIVTAYKGRARLATIDSRKFSMSFEVSDIDLFPSGRRDLESLKTYFYLLSKVALAYDPKPKTAGDSISVLIDELIEVGIFKTHRIARRGLMLTLQKLISVIITDCDIRTKDSEKAVITHPTRLFDAYSLPDGYKHKQAVVIKISQTGVWQYVCSQFTILPQAVFGLADRKAFLLAVAISQQLRLQSATTVRDGRITISFPLLKKILELPTVSRNPTRDIYKPIVQTVEILNEFYANHWQGNIKIEVINGDTGCTLVVCVGSIITDWLGKIAISNLNKRKKQV